MVGSAKSLCMYPAKHLPADALYLAFVALPHTACNNLMTGSLMTSCVVHALVQKREELSGEIESTHNNLKRVIQELEHLDKTLLMFDPDDQVDSIKPKAFRPPEDWSKRGEMTRRILDILRKASEPMSDVCRRVPGGRFRSQSNLPVAVLRRDVPSVVVTALRS
jgi:hypothetical protein